MRLTAGFTLVELLMVLFMVVIIGAYAGPRFLSSSEQSVEFFLDEVATAFDYARTSAMSSGCAVEFTITATGYSAKRPAVHCDTSSFSADLAWADGSVVIGSLPAGLTLAGDVGTTVRLLPDASTNQAADRSIRSGARELLIHAQSGVTEVR